MNDDGSSATRKDRLIRFVPRGANALSRVPVITWTIATETPRDLPPLCVHGALGISGSRPDIAFLAAAYRMCITPQYAAVERWSVHAVDWSLVCALVG